MSKKNGLYLVLWIVGFQIIGGLIGYITMQNIHPWYETLTKSPLNPPNHVFSVVWVILYFLLAIIGFYLHHAQKAYQDNQVRTIFWLQMLIGWAWTPIFFVVHMMLFSFITMLVLIILGIILWIKCYKIRAWLALLLTPYLFWLIFASYLNAFIVWHQ